MPQEMENLLAQQQSQSFDELLDFLPNRHSYYNEKAASCPEIAELKQELNPKLEQLTIASVPEAERENVTRFISNARKRTETEGFDATKEEILELAGLTKVALDLSDASSKFLTIELEKIFADLENQIA